MNYTKVAFLFFTCLLIGTAVGYLRSVREEQIFRAEGRFRVSAPSYVQLPNVLVDQLLPKEDRKSNVSLPLPEPLYLEGDKVRQLDVLRLAVGNGNLHKVKSLGGGTVETVAAHLATSPNLSVRILGISTDSAIFEVSFDANDPDLARDVVNSIINAYSQVHFPNQVAASDDHFLVDSTEVKQLVFELESAEADLAKALNGEDWPELANGSIASFRSDLAILRQRLDDEKRRHAEMVDRYDTARSLAKTQQPMVEVLAALRGRVELTEPGSVSGSEELKLEIKTEIGSLRDAIDKQNSLVMTISSSIDEQTQKMRQSLAAKSARDEAQKRVDRLRKSYDQAMNRFNGPDKLFDHSPRFEMIQSARTGIRIESGVPEEVKAGALLGMMAGAVLSLLIYAAATAVRKRRMASW